MQALSKKWYERSTDRTRTIHRRILLPMTFYFTFYDNKSTDTIPNCHKELVAFNKSRGIMRLKCKDPNRYFSNKSYISIQVGRN